MPRVIILTLDASAPLIAGADDGRFLDFCDEHAAPIAFSCRDANCGTCCVEVLEGAHTLLPPSDAERAVLAQIAAPPTHRLACCMTIESSGDSLATLRVRPVTRPRHTPT